MMPLKHYLPPRPEPPPNWGLEQCGEKICATAPTLDYLIDLEIWGEKIEAHPAWAD